MEALYQKFRADGLMLVTLISDADHGDAQAVNLQDVQLWASEYGINHPVLQDSSWVEGRKLWSRSYFFDEGRGYAAPQYMVMKPGLEIVTNQMWDYDDDIKALEEVYMPIILP